MTPLLLLQTILPDATSAQRPVAPDSIGIVTAGDSSRNRGAAPAGAKRFIRFTTTEGTWMSLDVSPDGRMIVFDLLGDLYTIPIKGGRARPLSSGSAWDAQPRFSPDGRKISFVSDRNGFDNLWIADVTGAGAHRISDLHVRQDVARPPISSPAWSPDGRTIVVSQRLGTVDPAPDVSQRLTWLLAAYDVGSGRLRWVSDTAAGRRRAALGPAFSPDGRSVYAAMQPQGATVPSWAAWHLARTDFATGAVQPAPLPSVGRASMRPVVSTDGWWLAYVSVSGTGLGLRLRDLRTHRERWLVVEALSVPGQPWTHGGSVGGARDLHPGYAFTPDSKALIIAYGGKINRVLLASGRQQPIPFVVDVKRELAPLAIHQFSLPDTAVGTRSVMQPALSFDGRRVAFSALDRVWVMDLPRDGLAAGQPWRLTADSIGEFYPSWSPDGRWIAYSTWLDGVGGEVRRAWVQPYRPLDRSRAPPASERLTGDTALYFNTSVAPDGQRVLALRAPGTPERLRGYQEVGVSPDQSHVLSLGVLDLAGGPPTYVSSFDPRRLAPFEFDGSTRSPTEQLYFTDDSARVYLGFRSYPLNSGEVRRHLTITDTENMLPAIIDISGVLSPDRRRALVTHRYTLSEVALPGKRDQSDTIEVEQAQRRPFASAAGAARRWGRALVPWITWSGNGRRALFVQGGTLFVGDVPDAGWTRFARVDVPLMVPVDRPEGILVLRGARLLTMREQSGQPSEVIPHGDIVVAGRRIVAVGRTGSVAVPKGAIVRDVTGKTILPGYVDIHDHVQNPSGVHGQQSWGMLSRLAFGVTALRDPYEAQTIYSDVFGYQERERAGDLIGPRMFSTGVAHLRSDRPASTLEEARELVAPTAEYFGAETFKEYSHDPWPELRHIAAAAQEAGLNSTIHTNHHLAAIVAGFSGIEHCFPIPLYDDALTFVARSGVTLTNTFAVTARGTIAMAPTGREPWQEARLRRFAPPSVRAVSSALWAAQATEYGLPDAEYLRPLLRNAAGIAARGGRIGMGAHGDIPGIGFHYEMWFHADGGMRPHDILRSATIVGATAIGHVNDFGSIEVGKLADLQILDRNPLDDIKNTNSVRYVMKNGRLYAADDLTEIYPRLRPLPAIYLFDDLPLAVETR